MIERIKESTHRKDTFMLSCTITNRTTKQPENYIISNVFGDTTEEGKKMLADAEKIIRLLTERVIAQARSSLKDLKVNQKPKDTKIEKKSDGSIIININ